MIKYKIDILEALKSAGYNTYKIKCEKLIGDSALRSIRRGEHISMGTLDKICCLTGHQPGDIIEYVPDEKDRETAKST